MSNTSPEAQPSLPIIVRDLAQGQGLAAALIQEAFETQLRTFGPEETALRWLVAHPEAPEGLLLELCDRGLYLDDLGHRPGPRLLLEKMAAQHRYPEAILTLGKQLYTDPQESATALRQFLTEHRDSDWLFESLAQYDASAADKEQVYLEIARGLPVWDKVETVRGRRLREAEAARATDAAEIERLYRLREPAVWRALAGNPHTPEPLLRRLSEVVNVPHARDVRNRARATLALRVG
jgi:hypothetical protein